MKASLQLKYSQNLTMTPQLQQAIKLLQLSSLELQQEIQQMLENNPMLELEEALSLNEESDYFTDYKEVIENDPDAFQEDVFEEQTIQITDTALQDPGQDLPFDMQEELLFDPGQQQFQTEEDELNLTSTSTNTAGEQTDFASFTAEQQTLQDHLLWQLNLLPISDEDKEIAYVIIESVNDIGYLSSSLDSLLETMNQSRKVPVEEDELVAVLHLIQQLEPPGVAARDLQECLQIQLKQLNPSTPSLPDALLLVEKYIHLLGSKDYAQIIRKTKLDETKLKQAIKLIQTLQPQPGEHYSTKEAEYIKPDIVVRKHKDEWHAYLSDDAQPRLRINSYYASLVNKTRSADDNHYLRSNMQEARWFIKSLQSRNETLLKVAREILKIQRSFFDYGPEAMRPLVLHDIAELLGMHESTISRVTTQKYMLTPKGIFELKYFFSSHVGTDSGGECSSTAIRALIKKLVSTENQKKPLSDSKIADLLSKQGINVARRTIAKYRESLSIPPSNERKQF